MEMKEYEEQLNQYNQQSKIVRIADQRIRNGQFDEGWKRDFVFWMGMMQNCDVVKNRQRCEHAQKRIDPRFMGELNLIIRENENNTG